MVLSSCVAISLVDELDDELHTTAINDATLASTASAKSDHKMIRATPVDRTADESVSSESKRSDNMVDHKNAPVMALARREEG